MTSVSQATEIVAHITDVGRSRVAQIARALIDGGVLPKSSGRDIKKVPAGKLLSLLAAVVMSDKVADAVSVAQDFESLPLQGADTAGLNGETLSDFFGMLMRHEDFWVKPEVHLDRQKNGFAASITAHITNNDREEVPISLPFWRDAYWGGFCKTSFIISSEGIEVMRNLFKRKHDEEMHFGILNVELDPE